MKKFLIKGIELVLDRLVGPVLDPNDLNSAIAEAVTETVEEMANPPKMVVAAPVTEPAPAQSSNWKHCDKPEYYRVIVPEDAVDPRKNQPAYMATIIEDKETGDVRMIPYMNVPVLLKIEATLDPKTKKVDQNQTVLWNLPEN